MQISRIAKKIDLIVGFLNKFAKFTSNIEYLPSHFPMYKGKMVGESKRVGNSIIVWDGDKWVSMEMHESRHPPKSIEINAEEIQTVMGYLEEKLNGNLYFYNTNLYNELLALEEEKKNIRLTEKDPEIEELSKKKDDLIKKLEEKNKEKADLLNKKEDATKIDEELNSLKKEKEEVSDALISKRQKLLGKKEQEIAKKLEDKSKEFKAHLADINEKNKTSLANREKVLKELKKLGLSDYQRQQIKLVMIRFSSPDQIINYLEKVITETKEKEEIKTKKQEEKIVIDQHKKEFFKSDLDFIKKLVLENKDMQPHEFQNLLLKYYNSTLVGDIVQLMSKTTGADFIKYLNDPDEFKNKILELTNVTFTPKNAPKMYIPHTEGNKIVELINIILMYIHEVADKHPAEYNNSLHEYTENILKIVRKYFVSKKNDIYFEHKAQEYMTELISKWSKSKKDKVIKDLKEIRNLIQNATKNIVIEKGPVINEGDEDAKELLEEYKEHAKELDFVPENPSPYYNEIKNIKNIPDFSQADQLLSKAASIRKSVIISKVINKLSNNWQTDVDDLVQFSQNDEHLYNSFTKMKSKNQAMDLAEEIIETYNKVTERFPQKQFQGDIEELAKALISFKED